MSKRQMQDPLSRPVFQNLYDEKSKRSKLYRLPRLQEVSLSLYDP